MGGLPLTNLDPIVTESWRARTQLDYNNNAIANNKIISFNASYEELISLVRQYKIRWIVSRVDENYVKNHFGIIKFITFKEMAGDYSVWEVNY